MKNFLFALLLLFTATAYANGPWKREVQNITLPTQQVLEHVLITNPAAGATTAVQGFQLLNTNLPTILTSFAGQPDVPRNISVTPFGTTGAIGAGNVVVSGLNTFGKPISESLPIAKNNFPVYGQHAFKSVSSVQFPATTNSGAAVSIGVGTSLGLPSCVNNPGDLAWTEYGGVFETTRAVMFAGSQTDVSSNLVQPNGTLDGAHSIDVLYFQNFRCYGN